MMTKKKTILAAALVVAIVALAGVGYAAFSASYSGTAQQTATNEFDVDWVVITPGTAAYSSVNTELYVMYDTSTAYSNGEIIKTFTWIGSSTVGHYLEVIVPDSDNGQGDSDDPDYYTITASISNFTTPDGYQLQYRIVGQTAGTWSAYSGSSVTLESNVTSIASNHVNGWDGTSKQVEWRYVPLDGANAATEGVAIADPSFRLTGTYSGYFDLPAIVYSVTANQTNS